MPVPRVPRVHRPAGYPNRPPVPGGNIAPGGVLGRILLAGLLAACLAAAAWTPSLLAQQTANPSPKDAPAPIAAPISGPISGPISVAVLDFGAFPEFSQQSEAFSKRIGELLANDTRFQIMERGRMNLALAASDLLGKPCLETGCAAAAGRALQVERVIVGELSFFDGKTWRATALMVDVSREKTLAAQWVGGEMDFEAFLAEKPGLLALRLIMVASSAGSPLGTAAPLPSVPAGPPLEPADKAPGDTPGPLAAATKKPKKHRPKLQRKSPFRLSLTFGEFQVMALEISDLSGPGEDTFNEIVNAVGVGLGFEWLFPGKGPTFSLFTAFHYGAVNEVRLDDDEPDVASGQTVSGVGLPVNFKAGGIFSQTEIGVGVNFLFPNWRIHAGLAFFSLLAQYDFQDTILSSGRPTGWEVKGRGLNGTFLFEYISGKNLTLGGIFQTGRVYTFEGSRIDGYEKAGYVIKRVFTESAGFRIGYGF